MTSESCNVRKLLSLVKNNSNMITVNMLLILILLLLLLLLLNQIKSIHYTSGVILQWILSDTDNAQCGRSQWRRNWGSGGSMNR